MSKVMVATWNKIGNRVYEAGFVSNDYDEPIVFDTRHDAETWIDENDGEVCGYTRIIEIDG